MLYKENLLKHTQSTLFYGVCGIASIRHVLLHSLLPLQHTKCFALLIFNAAQKVKETLPAKGR